MYEFQDDDDEGGGRGRTLALIAAAVLLATGWFVVRPAMSSDDGGTSAGAPGDGGFEFDSIPVTTAETTTTTEQMSTTAVPTTARPTTMPATSTTTVRATTTTESQPTEAIEANGVPKSMAAATVEALDPTYITLPDGSPAPVEIMFGSEQVTLVGAVPSQEAADQLVAFAESIRLTTATIVDELTIDPAVPATVDVRVVERNAVVFNEGSSTVHAEHAQQLDRFVAAMNSAPGSTVLVVAHSDQRNGEDRNLEISEERAQSVLEYFADQGIDPSRLAAVGVGESEPLTLEESEEAYRVNRRVDFVFTGLFTA